MQKLGTWTGTSEASFINRIQEIEEKISGVEDMIEEIDSSIKHYSQQSHNTKHSRNLGHH